MVWALVKYNNSQKLNVDYNGLLLCVNKRQYNDIRSSVCRCSLPRSDQEAAAKFSSWPWTETPWWIGNSFPPLPCIVSVDLFYFIEKCEKRKDRKIQTLWIIWQMAKRPNLAGSFSEESKTNPKSKRPSEQQRVTGAQPVCIVLYGPFINICGVLMFLSL